MTDGLEGRQVGQSDGGEAVEAPLPRRLIEAVRADYHAPSVTPRDEIWSRIEAARRARTPVSPEVPPESEITPRPSNLPGARRPWLRYVTGIAALLALGIGIGRVTTRSTPVPSQPSPVASSDRSGPAYAIATANHLSRVETFLTTLRTTPGNGQFAGQARDLLTSTRLLLDSPGTTDPRVRALLEDLETVLVQVTTLDGGRNREELDLITDGLEQREVLPRLRTIIPAGAGRQL
jgi:hypothetical protein